MSFATSGQTHHLAADSHSYNCSYSRSHSYSHSYSYSRSIQVQGRKFANSAVPSTKNVAL